MEIFVHQQNLLFYRKLLAEPQDEERRQRLVRLLAEEEAKYRTGGQSENPAGE